MASTMGDGVGFDLTSAPAAAFVHSLLVLRWIFIFLFCNAVNNNKKTPYYYCICLNAYILIPVHTVTSFRIIISSFLKLFAAEHIGKIPVFSGIYEESSDAAGICTLSSPLSPARTTPVQKAMLDPRHHAILNHSSHSTSLPPSLSDLLAIFRQPILHHRHSPRVRLFLMIGVDVALRRARTYCCTASSCACSEAQQHWQHALVFVALTAEYVRAIANRLWWR